MMTPTHSCATNRLDGLLRRVQETEVIRNHGRVVQLIGLVIESEGRKIGDVEEDFAQESSRGDVRRSARWA